MLVSVAEVCYTGYSVALGSICSEEAEREAQYDGFDIVGYEAESLDLVGQRSGLECL